MKRIDGPTPNGGAYALIYYYDNLGNRATAENASVSYAQEYSEDGKLIHETTFIKKNAEEKEILKKNSNDQKSIQQMLLENTMEIPIIKK